MENEILFGGDSSEKHHYEVRGGKTLTEKALDWWDKLDDQEKDALQYELSTPLNYTRWGKSLKIKLYKKIHKL